MSTKAPPDTRFVCPLGDVERELTRQMRALQGAGSEPLQRARMSNLVIFCSSLEQSIFVNEQVYQLSASHPARALLVVGEPGPAERDVSARITVRPVAESGSKQFACVEQVTLHASGAAVDRLPFAVRGLLIGDLPINLWWAAPQPPPLAGPLLYELGEYAQQILFDSIGWPDPARGMAATASWLEQIERPGGRWRVASDLNWRRLKYWRRLMMQALDPTSTPGAAESATEMLIEHGPHAVIQAWELASWLSRRLGWTVQGGKIVSGQEMEMSWRFKGPPGEARVRVRRLEQGPPEIRRVRIACKLMDRPGAIVLAVGDGQRLSMSLEGVEGAPRTLALPPHSAADLIGKQLSDRERDPVFRESMAVAQVMARSLLH
jgi:glucose-6-phosphate dehydrogenase assembly protein OpcA